MNIYELGILFPTNLDEEIKAQISIINQGKGSKVQVDKNKPIIIIPVKEFSKRCPRKWGREIKGVSLLERTIRTALVVTSPENVIVTSSSPVLLKVAIDLGVATLNRPTSLDDVNLEIVVHWCLVQLGNPITNQVILLQVTNPFVTSAQLQHALSGRVMGVAHCGAFYSQSAAFWCTQGLKDKSVFRGVLIDPSIDIDTEDDFIKAKNILEN